MKRFTKIRTNSSLAAFVVLLALLAAVLTGCADKDLLYPQAQSPSQEMHGVQIGLQVSVPVFGTTRTPSGSYDDARLTDYENFLDINLNAEKKNFRIYFFTLDNQFITEFVPTEFVEDDTQAISPNAKLYTLRGNLTSSLGPDFKIVLLANWGVDNYPTLVWQKDGKGNTTQRSTMADLSQTAAALAHTFTGPLSLGAGEGKQYIPMFGIKTCTGKSFVNEMLTWCDKIHLLRAVAKIEVIEAEESLEAIQAVRLHNYNATGVCASKNVYTEDDYIKNEYMTDYVSHVTLLGDANDTAAKSTPLTQVAGTNKWVIYVPEYQNLTQLVAGDEGYSADKIAYNPKSVRPEACWLEVDMQNKQVPTQTGTYNVLFKYYTQSIAVANGCEVDDHFNIQRNYDYRFTVTRGTEFEIVAEVLRYTSVVLNPLYGMTRDPEGRIVDIHGRLINYQGNLMQENEDGKLYLTAPLFTLAPYLPEIGTLVNDHNEPVDELGRRIHSSGWLLNDEGTWNMPYNADLNPYIIDASGENATISFNESSANLGYLTNATTIIDNYGNTLTLDEDGITTRDGKRCDRWGHLIAVDASGNITLVNEDGELVDIYQRRIKVLTLTIGGETVQRAYLIDASSNYIDSKGNRITVNETTGVMYDSYGRAIDKNGRPIYNYTNPGTLGVVGDGHTFYVKYFGVDEVTITSSNQAQYTSVTLQGIQYYIRKVNKFNEFIDDQYCRVNEDGQLIDNEGNLIKF